MANAEAEMAAGGNAGKKGKGGLAIGGGLAILLGAASFYAVQTGMILAPEQSAESAAEPSHGEDHALPELSDMADVTFVPLDPIVVSLGPESRSKHLRFRAQLEVDGAYSAEVERLSPRVIDVLNSYLRAVEPALLDEPGALARLRSQMLRRVQLVIGDGKVRDLLVMEFVLS